MIENNEIGLPNEIFVKYIFRKGIEILVNPCGEWRVGGPVSDCGVTGRKIIVDAYGGYCNAGGGCQSGKDYSKVDRSGAYMARYLAKNIVATGVCNNAKVELSYAISVPYPTAINVELDKNCEYQQQIIDWIRGWVDLTPSGIFMRFDGSYPRNLHLAKNGNYGYDVSKDEELAKLYPWEKLDLADKLKLFLGL